MRSRTSILKHFLPFVSHDPHRIRHSPPFDDDRTPITTNSLLFPLDLTHCTGLIFSHSHPTLLPLALSCLFLPLFAVSTDVAVV
jgi:hypothetical protein